MSRKPGPYGVDPFSPLLPARTPGPLGRNDAGDPDASAEGGDTPGPLGTRYSAGKVAGVFNFFAGGEVTVTNKDWVRPNLHGLKPIGQALSTLCWLTCYQMLYIWKGLNPSTIEGKLRGAGLDYDAACKRGLLPDEMPSAARALGLSSYADGSGIDVAHLKTYLNFSPLWVAGEWFQNALHARLVTGANDDWVECFDSWFGGTAGGSADSHKEMQEVFLHGDRSVARGMDKLKGKYQLSYWRL